MRKGKKKEGIQRERKREEMEVTEELKIVYFFE